MRVPVGTMVTTPGSSHGEGPWSSPRTSEVARFCWGNQRTSGTNPAWSGVRKYRVLST